VLVLSRPYTGFVAVAFGYAIKFAGYGFLTPVVLMIFAALMFVYITLAGPEVPFFTYLSFILPVDSQGNLRVNENDIINAFGLLTVAFFVLSAAGGGCVYLLKRIAKQIFQAGSNLDEENKPANLNSPLTIRRRLIVSSIVITVIYLVLFAVIPFAKMAEGTSFMSMYPVFIVFYIVIMLSNAIFIGIDSLSNLVLAWGWSQVGKDR